MDRDLTRVRHSWMLTAALILSVILHLLFFAIIARATAPHLPEPGNALLQAPILIKLQAPKPVALPQPTQQPTAAPVTAHIPRPEAMRRAHKTTAQQAGHAAHAPVLSEQTLLSQALPAQPEPSPPRTRQLVYGSSARGYQWRQYMDSCIQKLERIGTLSFPQEVSRQGLSGGPILSVVLNADGSLNALRIVQSSGNATLDQAAQQLVRTAAPFAPFPAELAAQANTLEIRRKWFFSTDNNRLSMH